MEGVNPRQSSWFLRLSKTISLLLVVAFLSILIPVAPVRADVVPNATVNGSYVNVRASSTTSSSIVAVLYCGHRVQITGPLVNTNWYPVKFTDLDSVEKTGFVHDSLVMLDATDPIDPESPFELSIADFPDSYKIYLRALHQKYPNWIFQPYFTDLEWNVVLQNEAVIGRSLIENTVNDAWQSTYTQNDATLPGWTPSVRDAYNWLTDTYIPYDASRWVNTAEGFVEYSLDPRNFLSDKQIFQFLLLSYDPSTQNIETVQTLLDGTFMESDLIQNTDDEDITYAQAVMDAADTYQVNPYFLVARMKQEILLSTGQPCGTASGVYPGYEGYYNFYNIGAISNPEPVIPALIYAKGENVDPPSTTYLRPWNSQYKAILGGAEWIESGYISEERGQDTLYFQRWDVIPLDGLYWHQYMTSTQAPVSEAIRLYPAYENILDLPLVFKIPVYTNMPESPVRPPEKKGNPNNWLTSISVEGQALTPSFDPNIFEYDLIVGSGVGSVNLSATAASLKPAMAGSGFESFSHQVVETVEMIGETEVHIFTHVANGVCDLETGNNEVQITVTAEDGSVREYLLNIIRLDSSAEPLFTTDYAVEELFISGLSEKMTVEDFLGGMSMIEGASAQYTDSLGNAVTDQSRIICTGDRLRVYDSEGTLVNVYTVLLYGDATGDGRINSYDLTSIAKHVLKDLTLGEVSQITADVDRSGRINSYDLTMIARYVLREAILPQRGENEEE
ncbi:MAG: cadherin-like beta sandwich domain-containing protein [Clostridiales bacterium]|nr:cadherin-like beta sandwich domain-containing protein [Clostridiales bacterium]